MARLALARALIVVGLSSACVLISPSRGFSEGRTVLDQALRKELLRLASGKGLALALHDCLGVRHFEASYAHLDTICRSKAEDSVGEPAAPRATRLILQTSGAEELLRLSLTAEIRDSSTSAAGGNPGSTRHPLVQTTLRPGESRLVDEARAFGVEPFLVEAVPMRPDPPPRVQIRNPFPELDVQLLDQTWHRAFLRLRSDFDRPIRWIRFYQRPVPTGKGSSRGSLGHVDGTPLVLPGEDVLYVIRLDHSQADGSETLIDTAVEITEVVFTE
jgi:hypothetical protein